jgi:hypothetical protein
MIVFIKYRQDPSWASLFVMGISVIGILNVIVQSDRLPSGIRRIFGEGGIQARQASCGRGLPCAGSHIRGAAVLHSPLRVDLRRGLLRPLRCAAGSLLRDLYYAMRIMLSWFGTMLCVYPSAISSILMIHYSCSSQSTASGSPPRATPPPPSCCR